MVPHDGVRSARTAPPGTRPRGGCDASIDRSRPESVERLSGIYRPSSATVGAAVGEAGY
jgi:hypothetical protein